MKYEVYNTELKSVSFTGSETECLHYIDMSGSYSLIIRKQPIY